MDTRPTTEEHGGLNWDQPMDKPEVKSGIMLPQKISELRKKLAHKAKQEPQFRFYALYDRVYREDVLRTAASLVLNHDGAAGVDGVTCQDLLSLDEPAWNAFFRELHEELRTKRYRPQPVKRVYIPKPDGRLRPLGIPTVKDRIVQTAVLLVLEPIFEADFLDSSYGFRPGRNAHQAIDAIRQYLAAGFTEVYDADLKSYFDTIPHDALIKCLERRIADGKVLKLIRMWLESPVVENDDQGRKKVSRPKQGTPQGGVISPPTILRIAPAGGSVKREWANLVFDSDRVVPDLHFSDQRSHDLSPGAPVRIFKPLSDSRRKQPQVVDRRLQVLGVRLPIGCGFGLEFQFREPLFCRADAGLELIPLQEPFLVGIDQPRNPTPNATD